MRATCGSATSPFGLFWKVNFSFARPLNSFDDTLWKKTELSLSNSVVTRTGGRFWKENIPNEGVFRDGDGGRGSSGNGADGGGGWGWKEEGPLKRIKECGELGFDGGGGGDSVAIGGGGE